MPRDRGSQPGRRTARLSKTHLSQMHCRAQSWHRRDTPHRRGRHDQSPSDSEIACKLGCSNSWVANVVSLLERGEKRLLAAAEAGLIPIHLAVSISRATDGEVQQLLLDAYEAGELKGRKVTVVRKILESRARSGKRTNDAMSKGAHRKQMTAEDLARLYKRDVEVHKRIQKKAEYTQKCLLLAQQIFKELFADKRFCALLKAEKLANVPAPLAALTAEGGSR